MFRKYHWLTKPGVGRLCLVTRRWPLTAELYKTYFLDTNDKVYEVPKRLSNEQLLDATDRGEKAMIDLINFYS